MNEDPDRGLTGGGLTTHNFWAIFWLNRESIVNHEYNQNSKRFLRVQIRFIKLDESHRAQIVTIVPDQVHPQPHRYFTVLHTASAPQRNATQRNATQRNAAQHSTAQHTHLHARPLKWNQHSHSRQTLVPILTDAFTARSLVHDDQEPRLLSPLSLSSTRNHQEHPTLH